MNETNLELFTSDLASGSPAPGGGGAAALTGALGAALASMVANLTTGKKKYACFEEDIQRILKDSQALRAELLSCIDEDEKCFLPLSKAYGIPKDDPGRSDIMEKALRTACSAPLHIMKLSAKAIDLHAELAEKGSTLMISDVGVGVQCCRAALLGASLNILINTNMMKDRHYAENSKLEVSRMIGDYIKLADETYAKVLEKIN